MCMSVQTEEMSALNLVLIVKDPVTGFEKTKKGLYFSDDLATLAFRNNDHCDIKCYAQRFYNNEISLASKFMDQVRPDSISSEQC